MSGRIAVIGAGAVGSYIGAFIGREGHDITLIDMWGPHVDRINEHGMRVSGPQGDHVVPLRAVHLADAHQIKEPFDVIFLSVKSYDTEWATHFAKRFLATDGVLVSAQNCMNDQLIASIVGYHREIPCVVSGFAVALWEPGFVTRRHEAAGDHKVFRVGELHGRVTPRVEELARLLACVDGAYATSNIWGERWAKLTLNAASNPTQAMASGGSTDLGQDPRARQVYIQSAKETVRVGQALNYDVGPVNGIAADVWARADDGDAFEEVDAKLQPRPNRQNWMSSMSQDVRKGRKTEIEQMNGYIVEKGREAGIPTPVNAAIVKVVKDIEAGRLSADPSNVERVLSMAGL